MSVSIRKMKNQDFSAVSTLSAQLGYPVEVKDLQLRFDDLENNPEHWLGIAEVDQQVVGFIHASKYLDLIEPTTVQIIALVVDENVRGKGVGAKLVSAVEDWSRSIGVLQIWVRSNIKRDRAHAFYQRLGYPITKTSHKFTKIIE